MLNGELYEQVEGEYTIIYAVKDDKIPPTPEEAVNFWKTGYDKLGSAPSTSVAGHLKGADYRELTLRNSAKEC